MQGNLREIDVHSILTLVELGQWTGELLIEAHSNQFWFLFFHNGEIIYATSQETNLARLRDHLHGIGLTNALEQVMTAKLGINVVEYGQIWSLLESQVISTKQAVGMVQQMILEVLFDVLGLYQGTFVLEVGDTLAPQLTSVRYSNVGHEIQQCLKKWHSYAPRLTSTEQCPILLQPEALPSLHPWLDGNNSIRRLARYTRQSIFQVASLVHNAMVAGTVSISPIPPVPLTAGDEPAPKILCIDDSPTICRAVEYILNNNGYQVTAISSPVKALGLMFQQKPNLILCDIAMPEIDGYELCAMLRKSSTFAQIPVIMLTGKDGFIDRVKARMVGANEYLTKPFGEKELLTMVKKYLSQNRNITSSVSDRGNLVDRPPLGILGMY